MCLDIKNLSVGYDNKTVVKDVNVSLGQGNVLAVLGANGSGKTTFLRTVTGLLPAVRGDIMVCGENIESLGAKKKGQMISYVPQNHNCTFSLSVREIAVMGRNPYIEGTREPSKHDYMIVDEVLNTLKIENLSHRKFTRLSGGEKKLVLIARALVQQPKLLVMDEPTSELDIKNTVKVLERILCLKQDSMSIIINTHSPKEAKVFADSVLMLKGGEVYKNGNARLLQDKEVLNGLYSINTAGLDDKLCGFIKEIA